MLKQFFKNNYSFEKFNFIKTYELFLLKKNFFVYKRRFGFFNTITYRLFRRRKITPKTYLKLLRKLIRKIRKPKATELWDFTYMNYKPIKYSIIKKSKKIQLMMPFSFNIKKTLTYRKGRKTYINLVLLKFTSAYKIINLNNFFKKNRPKYYIYNFYKNKKKYIFFKLIKILFKLKKNK